MVDKHCITHQRDQVTYVGTGQNCGIGRDLGRGRDLRLGNSLRNAKCRGEKCRWMKNLDRGGKVRMM